MLKIKCSHCNAQIAVSMEKIECFTLCSHCGNEIVIKLNELFTEDHKKAGSLGKLITRLLDSNIATPVLTIILYITFYAIILAFFPKGSLTQRMLAHGWIPYLVIFLTVWATCALCVKSVNTIKQYKYLTVNYLPESIDICDEDNIDNTCDTIIMRAKEDPSSILALQIISAMERFKLFKSIREVENLWRERSDSTWNSAESSYAQIRVIIWAIPILGFIGTIQGISNSVTGLSSVLGKNVEDISQIISALTHVTTNLGAAFDTTLIALSMTVIVVVLMSVVENQEFKTLGKIECYGRDKVLPLLAPTMNDDLKKKNNTP